MRKIILTYQKNIRDLGGMPAFEGKKVKYNKLFRGGYLGHVSEEDIDIIKSLHLTDIIDFRGNGEFLNRPDHQFLGVNFHNLPMMKEDVKKEDSKTEDSNLLWFLGDNTDGFKHMYNLYPELVLDDVGIKSLRKFFRILVDNPAGVFYFHCSQGKDRAGMAAYLLEIALGVDQDLAREDYLLSNEAMKIRVDNYLLDLEDKAFFNETYKKALFDVFSAKNEFLDHALEGINSKYGSVLNYLNKELKVDVDKLRALYLE